MTSPTTPAMSATCCKRWDDGGCDFGCQCDDCKPVPMTPEQVREYYARMVPVPACGNVDCNGGDCGPCAEADHYDRLDHERAHSAARLG